MRTAVVATGLSHPVAFVMDPPDHSTFYVVEQRGTIRAVRKPFSNHNGGHLAFGPDTYLCVPPRPICRSRSDSRLPAAGGMSITGGFVYRGAALDPMYNGRYFFADDVAASAFGVNEHAEMYIVSYSHGRILKIAP